MRLFFFLCLSNTLWSLCNDVDLRIKPSREYGPTLLYPASISGENEAEVRDCNGGDALDRARDNTLFDEFVSTSTPLFLKIVS